MVLTVLLLQGRLDGFYVFLLILPIDMLHVLQNILGKVGLDQWELYFLRSLIDELIFTIPIEYLITRIPCSYEADFKQ